MCPHAQIQLDQIIRCVLVHDHVLLREGLRRLLEDEPDMKVVAETETTEEALETVLRHRPDVVIADAHILACPVDEWERAILQVSPGSKILFLSAQESPVGETSLTAQKTSAAQLVRAVRRTAEPDKPDRDGRELTPFPLQEIVPRKRVLTAREREVLKLLAEGRTVRSTAEVLGLSVKTVDAHKFNLMRKLGIHNKAELVMWAIQERVVKLPVNF